MRAPSGQRCSSCAGLTNDSTLTGCTTACDSHRASWRIAQTVAGEHLVTVEFMSVGLIVGPTETGIRSLRHARTRLLNEMHAGSANVRGESGAAYAGLQLLRDPSMRRKTASGTSTQSQAGPQAGTPCRRPLCVLCGCLLLRALCHSTVCPQMRNVRPVPTPPSVLLRRVPTIRRSCRVQACKAYVCKPGVLRHCTVRRHAKFADSPSICCVRAGLRDVCDPAPDVDMSSSLPTGLCAEDSAKAACDPDAAQACLYCGRQPDPYMDVTAHGSIHGQGFQAPNRPAVILHTLLWASLIVLQPTSGAQGLRLSSSIKRPTISWDACLASRCSQAHSSRWVHISALRGAVIHGSCKVTTPRPEPRHECRVGRIHVVRQAQVH